VPPLQPSAPLPVGQPSPGRAGAPAVRTYFVEITSLSKFVAGWQQPAWEVAGDFTGNGTTQLMYQDPDSTSIYLLTRTSSGMSLSAVVTGWQ